VGDTYFSSVYLSRVCSRRPILTSVTARRLLDGAGQVSLDLGLSEAAVEISNVGVVLPHGEVVIWEDLEEVSEREGAAFFVERGSVFQAAVSDGGFLKLLPTAGAPTLEIDGVRMHRTVGTTPDLDARVKLEALGVDGGRILDTCTGLGYTALEALRQGGEIVVSVEIRPGVLRIAGLNPWSAGLFEDGRVDLVLGDSGGLVGGFPDMLFDYVVHDPPRFSHAGHLYAGAFYDQLLNVLRPGGRLFHYTGEPGSRRRRVDLRKGVMERLRRAGFVGVSWVREALGVVCSKPG
jgi:predicted methyltransferase